MMVFGIRLYIYLGINRSYY